MTPGMKLKIHRISHGLKQTVFAGDLEISREYLSRLECDHHVPSEDLARSIEGLTGIPRGAWSEAVEVSVTPEMKG